MGAISFKKEVLAPLTKALTFMYVVGCAASWLQPAGSSVAACGI